MSGHQAPVDGRGMHVLVTGAAGFIGMHAARALLDAGARVTGVDSFDPYYDVRLKEARVATLGDHPGFALPASRSRRAPRRRPRCSATAASRTSCISPRRRACATR